MKDDILLSRVHIPVCGRYRRTDFNCIVTSLRFRQIAYFDNCAIVYVYMHMCNA